MTTKKKSPHAAAKKTGRRATAGDAVRAVTALKEGSTLAAVCHSIGCSYASLQGAVKRLLGPKYAAVMRRKGKKIPPREHGR